MNNLKKTRLKFKKGGMFNTNYPKYQLGKQFISSDQIIVPKEVSGIPKIISNSQTQGFKGGYVKDQKARTNADLCFKIINNKRTQVTCDGSDEEIVIPVGSTKTQQEEIFRREEKLRTSWNEAGKQGSTKTIKGLQFSTVQGYEKGPEKGSGENFKKNNCKCTSDSPSVNISIQEFKSKLAGLPASASGVRKWGQSLISAAQAKKATDESIINLVYAKIVQDKPSTLDSALLNGCMCGGSGKVITPYNIPGKIKETPDSPGDDGIDETTKITKAVKGGYEDENPNKKKQPKGIVKFGVTVNLKGLKGANGNPINDMQQGVWYKGELVRNSNGMATGLKWSGPFTAMPQGEKGEEILDIGVDKGQSRSQFVNGLPAAQGGIFNIENAFSKPTFSSVQERDALIKEAINNKLSLNILNTGALETYVKAVREDWFKGDGGYGEEKVNTIQSKKLGGSFKFPQFGADSKLSYLFQK
jgi:hypothetical protein